MLRCFFVTQSLASPHAKPLLGSHQVLLTHCPQQAAVRALRKERPAGDASKLDEFERAALDLGVRNPFSSVQHQARKQHGPVYNHAVLESGDDERLQASLSL